ncbi:MAG: PqiC family protein [Deltaproteobacteria bacterium]|nr:PqiC family protein [Deltaproteobacteria bacterium]
MKAGGRLSRHITLLCGLVFLLLAACGTTAPTRFYLLDPLAEPGEAASAASSESLSITLAPVELPEHLNRPQIVTRKKDSMVGIDEFNRWAEPLKAGVTATLAENLSLLLGTDRISITNRLRDTGSDYGIAVNVLRFDGWPGGEATLVCRWVLYQGDAPEAPRPRRFSATTKVEGADYPALVTALSGMLAKLSREIAGQITSGL